MFFNLLPNLNDPELIKAFIFKTNDMMFNIYVSSLLRSLTALHDLINNKLEFTQQEALDETAGTDKKDDKKEDKDKKDDKKEDKDKKDDKKDDKKEEKKR